MKVRKSPMTVEEKKARYVAKREQEERDRVAGVLAECPVRSLRETIDVLLACDPGLSITEATTRASKLFGVEPTRVSR